MHYGGDGIPQDDVKAAYWFEQAAKSGHASALEKDTFIYKTNINNNTTRGTRYALTIFSPAVFYLGFPAYQNHKQQTRSQIALGEIDQIRLRIAEKRCFEQK